MAKASTIQTSFNAGELSPTLDGRVDLAKYANGCAKLENFLPLVPGGARKRSGTRFAAEVKDSANATRLIPFEFATTQAYVLEFGNLYMRVYKDGGLVTESTKPIAYGVGGTPTVVITSVPHGYANGDRVYITGTGVAGLDGLYWTITVTSINAFTLDGSAALVGIFLGGTVGRIFEIATDYTSASLAALQFAQSADVLYLAHPEFNPRKLARTADDNWTLSVIDFDYVPFEPQNLDDSLLVTASAVSGSGITLTANSPIFTSGTVNGQFKLAELIGSHHGVWRSESTNAEYSGVGLLAGGTAYYGENVYEVVSVVGPSGTSAPIHETGTKSDGKWDWLYQHSGEGYVTVTAVDADGYRATADVVKRLPDSTVKPDIVITGATQLSPVEVTTSGSHLLENGDKVWIQDVSGMVEINDREFTVSGKTPTTFELSGEDGTGHTLYSGGGLAIKLMTHRWAHGAWTGRNRYPRTVSFYEDRLWWAGTANNPQTLWGSKTGEYENHQVIPLDESALIFTLNTDQVNVIEWINAGKVLAVGTAGGEFVLSAYTDTEALVPGNVRVVRHSTYGSRDSLPAVRVGGALLFVQRAGRKVREFVYDDATDSYMAPDMTVLADHITLGGLTRLVFQQEPNRVIWGSLTNGALVGFTYEREQQVTAWHRHSLGGTDAKVESLAVIPHPDGDRDQLWLVVSRTVGGATKRHVEYLEADWERGAAVSSAFFVDAGLSYSGAAATTLYGLDHLEGETVSILADGATHPQRVVSGGKVELERSVTTASVGLDYSATLQTMRIEGGASDGTAQGKTKRITNVVLRLDQTGSGLLYGPTDIDADMDELHLRDSFHPMGAGVPLVDGDTDILSWPAGYGQDGRVTIKHTLPLPCTVTAIMPQLVTQDR